MGGTKFVHHVLSEFKSKKNLGKIYAIVENTSIFSRKEFEGIEVKIKSLNLPTSTNPFYWLFLPIFLIIDVLKIKKIMKEEKLNKNNTVVISGMFPMNVVAYFLNLKHIQNCYEPFAFFYDQDFISQFSLAKKFFIKFVSSLYSPLDKWGVKKADVVLTLNNITKKSIKNVYGVNAKKTQAGVNSSLFKPFTSKKIKSKYKKSMIAIHSTDYSPVKKTDLVIKAFAEASKKLPTAKLLITTTILDSAREKELKDLARSLGVVKKVEFLGFLPINELPQYYSLANVMIQGAFSESSGTTSMSLPVKEAMCCETPAIRPDVGGEDVIDDKTGYLVDSRNTKHLAQKIKILLENKELSKKMGKKAALDIKKKYTWENTAKTFLKEIP